MKFEIHPRHIKTPALELSYYDVPWDREILGVPVGQIGDIVVRDMTEANRAFDEFSAWCIQEHIQLCACRIPSERIVETMFLEQHGFRFIELNYAARMDSLADFDGPDAEIRVEHAEPSDREALGEMAGRVFRYGRLHQDPRIDPALGDKRYRLWMLNAFDNPLQKILKCKINDAIVAFFVVEYPQPTHCFWSLVGLAPGMAGRGFGKRVYRAMLHHHREQGMASVNTSISSHNLAVFNLCVALDFRFPEPWTTLQWRPEGAPVLR